MAAVRCGHGVLFGRRAMTALLVAAAAVAIRCTAFTAGPRPLPTSVLRAPKVSLRAADVDTVDVEDEMEIDDDDEDVEKSSYAWDEEPSKAWYTARSIDRHKVNMKFFDMFKKPVDFFPHKLQGSRFPGTFLGLVEPTGAVFAASLLKNPGEESCKILEAGDTIRVHYLEAKPSGDKETRSFSVKKDQLRETYFDGTILNFRGDYHARTMTVRAMIGKGVDSVGYEFLFPIHSPLITRIQVLKRGFIGRNKNAYFMRAMVGKRNVIPIDKERTEMDKTYANLRIDGREDEIPSPEYPQNEWDTYPLPVWKQDMADWNEEEYDPDKVDQRSEYERRVIAKYKMRVSRSGKYGT